MEQRDYLLKQMEQLGRVLGMILAKLLDLKGNGTATTTAVNQIFTEESGVDLAQLQAIEDSELVETLKREMNFDNANLEKLADIFLTMAEMTDDKPLYKKSLAIYTYLERTEKTYSFERNLRIQKIESLS